METVKSSGMFLSFWWEPRNIEFDFEPFTISWLVWNQTVAMETA